MLCERWFEMNYNQALMIAIERRAEWKESNNNIERWNSYLRVLELIAMAFGKDQHAVFADVINAYNNDWNWVK